jgi:uncharacterized protein
MKVAKGIDLPADAVTQTYGFIGRKGSGKTYAAGKLAESLLGEGCQVVVLDPVGNWYGLRLDQHGEKPSRYKVPILGGEHGDVPLEPGAGTIVADFVVSTGSSAVLDVSLFRKGQRKDFVAEFAEQLFQRKKTHRTPLMLVIEEAQVFAPQRADRGEERMLGAIEDIVRLGRNYGIGSAMISQRPQSVNKEVLNQCEPLVVFQLVAKHERDAVRGWMQHVGSEAQGLLDELPSLQTGECFFWSPAWLRLFERTRFLKKESYDASATPTLGQERPEPSKLKPVDLEALTEAMADTIERAKADDPKALRDEIKRLQKELANRPAEIDQAAIDQAIANRDRDWQAEISRLTSQSKGFVDRLQRIEQLARLNGEAEIAAKEPPKSRSPSPRKPTSAPRPTIERTPAFARDDRLRPAHQKLLDALAWLETFGLERPARNLVAAIAGVSPKSSSFKNDVSRLSSLGFVSYPRAGDLALTSEGCVIASYPANAPTLADLHEAWRNCPALRPAHVRLLDLVIDAYPDDLSREDLAERAGVSPASSSFKNDVSRLSSFGLIEYPESGRVVGSELLFPAHLTR